MRRKAAYLHPVLLQAVDVQQVSGGLCVVGQLRLSELRAERLQGLGRGLHHQGEGLYRLSEEEEDVKEEGTGHNQTHDEKRAETSPP